MMTWLQAGLAIVFLWIIGGNLQFIGKELRKIREATERKARAKEEMLEMLESKKPRKGCACKGGQYGEQSE